jgi:hypothetical protein
MNYGCGSAAAPLPCEALPLWESDLKRPEQFSNPALIANIQREGLRL